MTGDYDRGGDATRQVADRSVKTAARPAKYNRCKAFARSRAGSDDGGAILHRFEKRPPMIHSNPWLPPIAALGLFVVLNPAVIAQEQAVEAEAAVAAEPKKAALSEEQTRLNLESFDLVWSTIREKHFDPDLNGADWDGAREELRPKVAEATTMEEARDAMRDLIKRLKQTHFGIIPSTVYEAIDDDVPDGDGVTGLHVRCVDGEALVVAIDPEAPAAEDVEPGWVIMEIAGKEVGPALEKVAEAYGDSTLLDLYGSRTIENRLGGPVGEELTVSFRDGEGEAVERSIVLIEEIGVESRFGNLPPFHVVFRSRTVDDGIGYVHWSAFFDPSRLMPMIGEAVEGHLEAPGFIVDLRGNPGGIGAMAMGISGWFYDESGIRLGTLSTRDSSLNFVTFARAKTFAGPLAVLVDGCSASTAEILAGGLQQTGRARVFGTRSAGAALPSVVIKLPNGDGFQYAFANYVSADGEALEGKGVLPDEEAPYDREALLGGGDPALDAAVRWIRSQAGQERP